MSTLSLSLFYAALAILARRHRPAGLGHRQDPEAGGQAAHLLDGDGRRRHPAMLAGLPDLQSSIAFLAMTVVLMGGWAYFRTPNIKLDGRIWAAYPPNREPDPPPPGER